MLRYCHPMHEKIICSGFDSTRPPGSAVGADGSAHTCVVASDWRDRGGMPLDCQINRGNGNDRKICWGLFKNKRTGNGIDRCTGAEIIETELKRVSVSVSREDNGEED